MPDELPRLLRLGEAARRLGWSKHKMRDAVRRRFVKVDSHVLPLRSSQAGDDEHRGAEYKILAEDVEAIQKAIADASTRMTARIDEGTGGRP